MRRLVAVAVVLTAALLAGCDDQGNQKLVDANNLIGLGKYAEAEKLVREVLEKHPDHAKAYNNLGFLYSGQRQPDKAREAYLKSVELYEKDASGSAEERANAYDNLAVLEDVNGNNDQALEYYQK